VFEVDAPNFGFDDPNVSEIGLSRIVGCHIERRTERVVRRIDYCRPIRTEDIVVEKLPLAELEGLMFYLETDSSSRQED
jgi:hypothetical protein